MENMKKITINNDGSLNIPDFPVIAYIEGDGIGPDIWRAASLVIDSSVQAAYDENKKICWIEVYAGEKAYQKKGEWLPSETLNAIREHVIAIKGPLTTPVGKGIRSLNVTIRQELDLYACVRPVKYIDHVPSPMKNPEKVDMVVFRENTEDVYAGIEWESGSDGAGSVISFLKDKMGISLPEDSGIGI